jgi:uncharacterized protein YjbJ (UPF0337 family)
MDWNRVEGNWKQAKGKVKEQWGKLTDDDLTLTGKRHHLEGQVENDRPLGDRMRSIVDKYFTPAS